MLEANQNDDAETMRETVNYALEARGKRIQA